MCRYSFYPYKLIRKDYNISDSDEIRCRNTYGFCSSLTKKKYKVLIDELDGPLLVIKFYLKNDAADKKKYNKLSNLREPRNIVYTCISIIQEEFLKKNSAYSVGFIGSNCVNEDFANTKRFRFYKKMIASLVSPDSYCHYEEENRSAYVLIPKDVDDNNPGLIDQFTKMYRRHSFSEIICEDA